MVTLDSPHLSLAAPILPLSVVKASFYAGGPQQRFCAKVVSNLTELWRLNISG